MLHKIFFFKCIWKLHTMMLSQWLCFQLTYSVRLISNLHVCCWWIYNCIFTFTSELQQNNAHALRFWCIKCCSKALSICKILQKFDDKKKYFKGEGHPKPKVSMFCALSQNYQHSREKLYMHPIEQIVWETQTWHHNFSRSSGFKSSPSCVWNQITKRNSLISGNLLSNHSRVAVSAWTSIKPWRPFGGRYRGHSVMMRLLSAGLLCSHRLDSWISPISTHQHWSARLQCVAFWVWPRLAVEGLILRSSWMVRWYIHTTCYWTVATPLTTS